MRHIYLSQPFYPDINTGLYKNEPVYAMIIEESFKFFINLVNWSGENLKTFEISKYYCGHYYNFLKIRSKPDTNPLKNNTNFLILTDTNSNISIWDSVTGRLLSGCKKVFEITKTKTISTVSTPCSNVLVSINTTKDNKQEDKKYLNLYDIMSGKKILGKNNKITFAIKINLEEQVLLVFGHKN